MTVNSGKMTDLIVMLFGMGGGLCRFKEQCIRLESIWGKFGEEMWQCKVRYRENVASAMQKWLKQPSCHLGR